MSRAGLILSTTLVIACWTLSVSARSLDVVSESETAQSPDLTALNIPGVLDFEGGLGDNDVDGESVRDKRTPRFIFRAVSCLFTFLLNPSCLQSISGGGNGGGSGGSGGSFGANRRQQSSQPYYMISLPRYNDTDGNGTSTEYPIYPIESTSESYPDEPSRPTNPILAMIQWKLNLIPNMLRRFFPGLMGGRRDDSGSSGNGLLGFNLGLGGGRFANLFGGGGLGRAGGGLGGLGFGGLGGGGGGQY